jgi:hypothetical protein
MPAPTGIRGVHLPTLFAAGVALLGRPGEVHAQVAPQAVAPTTTWELVAGLLETWDSNPLIVQEGLGTPSFVHRAGLVFRHTRARPKGNLSLAGQGSGVVYQAAPQFNYVSYGGSGAGTFLLSPRASLAVSEDFDVSHRYEGALLGDATQLLPLVLTRVSVTQASLDLQLSRHTSLGVQGGYTYVSFDSPTLVDGTTVRGTISLSRTVSARDNLVLAYSIQQSRHNDTTFAQTLSAGWRRVVANSLSANLGAGASQYLGAAPGPGTWSFYATAGIDKTFRRGTLGARYSHAIDQAFGFGQDRVADGVVAHLTLVITRRLRLQTSGTYGYSRDAATGDFLFDTRSASAALDFQLTRRLSTSAGYSYSRRLNVGAAQPVSSSQVHLALSSGWQWH